MSTENSADPASTNGHPSNTSPESPSVEETEQERHDRLAQAVADGDLPLHKLPGDLSADESADIRRAALERSTETDLDGLSGYGFDAETVSNNNCENLIGAAQVPIGAAGPVPVRGEYANDDLHVPLATTEGALVASVNRGCAALRAAGGATVHVEDVGMTRAPVFRTSGIRETESFFNWIEAHEEDIREHVEATSEYLSLKDLRPFRMGTTVFVRFRFSTGDAMGMNMATLACDRVIQDLIVPETDIDFVSLSGNYCVDKKPAAINSQEGRGKRVFAETVLNVSVLHDVLKTTAADLTEVQYRKNLLGSAAAGSMGMNAHHANMVAAFFVATGQDIAQVVEGALGKTFIEPRGEDRVYVSIFMPDVPLAAVGGGTGLRSQKDALSMMGVSPDPEEPGAAVMRLAEILGATVLAGELSLMGALSSHHLARAHDQLGRAAPSLQNGHSSTPE
jgi:hydroxymethylglutaryl-CoA reductase (NADPH)